MIELCHIYPIKNQELYLGEKYVMVLAHLAEKGLYHPSLFNKDQFIIMDNGLYEGAQVSTSLERCVEIALKSGLHVKELVVPDVVNDLEGTIELFKKNWRTMVRYKNYFSFMFVAQCVDEDDLFDAIRWINRWDNTEGVRITVGISKLSPINRDSDLAIDLYKKCRYPIHFLGLKRSFEELHKLDGIIRSCDSCQLAHIAKNRGLTVEQPYEYVRSVLKRSEIDLEKEDLETTVIRILRERLNWEVILREAKCTFRFKY